MEIFYQRVLVFGFLIIVILACLQAVDFIVDSLEIFIKAFRNYKRGRDGRK